MKTPDRVPSQLAALAPPEGGRGDEEDQKEKGQGKGDVGSWQGPRAAIHKKKRLNLC